MKTEPIQIENRHGKVRMKDIVTKGLIDPLMDQICTLYGSDEVRNQAGGDQLETLEVEIDSEGGSVAEGYRLYKTILALRERGVVVIANVTNLAASMGSVIAMAATRVRMAEGSRMMIHEASASTRGDATKMQQITNTLEQISQEIAAIYATRTGLDVDVVRSAMKRETWLSAEACVKFGFADETYPSEPKQWNPSILERLIGNKAENLLIDTNATKSHYGEVIETKFMGILSSLNPDKELQAKLSAVETDLLENNAKLIETESELLVARTESIEDKSKIADLSEQIVALTEDITASKNALEVANTEYTSKLTALQSDLEAAQAKVTPEAIQALVTEELAKCSHRPVEVGSETASPQTTKKEVSRTEFNQMNPRQKSEFSLNGGKITE